MAHFFLILKQFSPTTGFIGFGEVERTPMDGTNVCMYIWYRLRIYVCMYVQSMNDQKQRRPANDRPRKKSRTKFFLGRSQKWPPFTRTHFSRLPLEVLQGVLIAGSMKFASFATALGVLLMTGPSCSVAGAKSEHVDGGALVRKQQWWIIVDAQCWSVALY